MNNGFDLLGADSPAPRPIPVGRTVLAVGAGIIGALLARKHHPMLVFLNVTAATSNVHAAVTKERTWKDAARRMGRHVVATAGSLALPNYPVIGYVGAAIAADLLIDGEGGGMIEEFSNYEGIRDRDVIDAKFTVEPAAPTPSTSLVKVDK